MEGVFQASNILTGLTAGAHNVTVKDANTGVNGIAECSMILPITVE